MAEGRRDKVYGVAQLSDFAGELKRQLTTKRDFTTSTMNPDFQFSCQPDPEFQLLTNGKRESFRVNDYCHSQIASKLEIPRHYYDRMLTEAPGLLERNVQHWMQADDRRVMLRTLDGEARAFLSDKYRPIDNYELMGVILPVISAEKMMIKEPALTDTRLYLKAVFPDMEREVPPPDGRHDPRNEIVSAGLIISNSEVGAGSVRVEAMIWTLRCSNALITGASLRKTHLGRSLSLDDSIREYLSDETKAVTDRAFMLQVADICRASMRRDLFDREVDKIVAARNDVIPVDGDGIQGIVETTGDLLGVSEKETNGILKYLIEGGELSRWGLVSAITREAQDATSYDRQVELERTANKIMELPSLSTLVVNR